MTTEKRKIIRGILPEKYFCSASTAYIFTIRKSIASIKKTNILSIMLKIKISDSKNARTILRENEFNILYRSFPVKPILIATTAAEMNSVKTIIFSVKGPKACSRDCCAGVYKNKAAKRTEIKRLKTGFRKTFSNLEFCFEISILFYLAKQNSEKFSYCFR